MIEQIKEWESKGFRPAIYPQLNKDKWLWVAGVYVGMSNRANWADSDNGLPRACYNTYQEAFNAITNYIKNYKPKNLKR